MRYSRIVLAIIMFCGVVPAGVRVAARGETPAPAEPQTRSRQASRPNIVLIFPDNLGWGEVGAYGSVRGVPPSIDQTVWCRLLWPNDGFVVGDY